MSGDTSELDISDLITDVTELSERFERSDYNLPSETQHTKRSQVFAAMDKLQGALGVLRSKVDPVSLPSTIFNPADPRLPGRFAAFALLTQPKIPLGSVSRFYGSGVYAIYYKGEFEAYKPLINAEHPIYIGTAAPESKNAKGPKEQGEKVSKRLREHAKSIKNACNLNIEDFDCRYLVISSGFQSAAEEQLIHLYKPLWNKETKICFGIGKHGDSHTTRSNKRSPWDVMHPGREWADKSKEDQKRQNEIEAQIEKHLNNNKVFISVDDTIRQFFDDFNAQS